VANSLRLRLLQGREKHLGINQLPLLLLVQLKKGVQEEFQGKSYIYAFYLEDSLLQAKNIKHHFYLEELLKPKTLRYDSRLPELHNFLFSDLPLSASAASWLPCSPDSPFCASTQSHTSKLEADKAWAK
jgi:hypothetical protein